MRTRLAAMFVLVVLLTACGKGAQESPTGGVQSTDSGPQHVHGLGINPADGALVIATHTGLFRANPGERQARRVGDLYQDTMGFTVVGPDRFLGSGHPDARADLPPLLGLIRSDDGGRTWDPVSLLGKADFHVLRAAGKRVYGFDSTKARLLVSGDGAARGRSAHPPNRWWISPSIRAEPTTSSPQAREASLPRVMRGAAGVLWAGIGRVCWLGLMLSTSSTAGARFSGRRMPAATGRPSVRSAVSLRRCIVRPRAIRRAP